MRLWNNKSVEIPEEFDTEQALGRPINTDPICSFNPKKKKQSRLFKNKASEEKFEKYFEENCFYESTCVFDKEKMGYKLGEIGPNNVRADENSIGLFGLISDECKLRMSYKDFLNITSPIYIGVVGCKYDDVKAPFTSNRMHKEKIGVMAVALDFISIMVMIFFFSKIDAIN